MVCSTDLLLFSLQIVRVKDEIPWLFPFLIGHCGCVFLLLCRKQLILFTDARDVGIHVPTFLECLWKQWMSESICMQKGVHNQHTYLMDTPRQPARMKLGIYQPTGFTGVPISEVSSQVS